MSTSHVLVTGGAGFIGSHTVDRLLDAGHRVTVLDDFSTGRRLNLATRLGEPELAVIEADVAQDLAPVLGPAVERLGPIERVVHLAAQTSVIKSLEDPTEDLRVNVGGTVAVLEYARAHAVQRVVFASSAAIYGDATRFPVDEALAPAPIAPYGVHKLASEHHLRVASAVYGVGTAALRFFNVYGPRQDPGSPYSGVISIFIDRALRGSPLTVFGDGSQTRDFVYVGDLVRAVVLAAFREGADYAAMNLGTGAEITVTELARTVLAATDSASEIVSGPARSGEIHRSVSSIERARALLGWTPEVPLEQGLRATAEQLVAERASVIA